MEALTFPSQLREISDRAFAGCEELRSVTFGENSRLTKIGLGAFGETGLLVFTAPPSLRIISQEAFYRCRQLKEVVLNEGLEVLGTGEYRNNWK